MSLLPVSSPLAVEPYTNAALMRPGCGASASRRTTLEWLMARLSERSSLLYPLHNTHVIRDRRAAHVENAAEAGARHLDVAGTPGELHGGERVHRHTGRPDRMTFCLEAAGGIDGQLAGLLGEALGDRGGAAAFRHKAHGLVFDQLGDGETVVRFDEREIAERHAGFGEDRKSTR